MLSGIMREKMHGVVRGMRTNDEVDYRTTERRECKGRKGKAESRRRKKEKDPQNQMERRE